MTILVLKTHFFPESGSWKRFRASGMSSINSPQKLSLEIILEKIWVLDSYKNHKIPLFLPHPVHFKQIYSSNYLKCLGAFVGIINANTSLVVLTFYIIVCHILNGEFMVFNKELMKVWTF